ncbi:MAG: hopanoid biosynthesis associated radical SAM protein HpnH [Acidobacteria bacterium RIFCSPLOWO2_12_FULL_54_10]|nr:MAG: hopanoid biosynthesis associated radical SAM protein HpnH [Acidobacteria bacterium RIFCSPLOWO2_12_FULL_54_10]
MPFSLSMTATMGSYILKNKLLGRDKFPLVMMLEPLHACNLTCTGCGRIREYKESIRETLTVEQCLQAAEECGSPIVSICGGEPMIYEPLDELVSELLKRGKFIYLCTNGMFIKKRLHQFRPSSRFFFNVHLDGLEETHDLCVERKGVYQAAIEGIKIAKEAGFLVCTNTTIYRETDMGEIEAMLDYLQTLDCDGHMLSPAYPYIAVQVKEIFMDRAVVREKFRDIDRLFRKYKLNSSPIYLEFLKGERNLTCTAWGNPTYNTKGWKGPCYLMTDAHHTTFRQLMDDTPWEKYGHGKDPRCQDCMVHCGYEPSAALGVNSKLGDTFKMMSWALLS